MNGDSVQFAGVNLGAQRHICAFFNTMDEEHRVLRSFYKDGFDPGEKAIHIVDAKNREDTRGSATLPSARASSNCIGWQADHGQPGDVARHFAGSLKCRSGHGRSQLSQPHGGRRGDSPKYREYPANGSNMLRLATLEPGVTSTPGVGRHGRFWKGRV
jgi:hypothetical protein